MTTWRHRFNDAVRALFRGVGLGIYPLRNPPLGVISRRDLIREAGVTLVIDVGANVGQYVSHLRRERVRERIVSFEPIPEAFAQLSARAAEDPMWDCHPFALSDTDGDTEFHVSHDLVSSSMLRPVDHIEAIVPKAGTSRAITVQTRQLDSITDSLIRPKDICWLKIDAEGSELRVLQGAKQTLARVAVVEMELATRTIYEDEPSMSQSIAELERLGFKLVSLAPAYKTDEAGLVRLDGIFVRNDAR